MSGPQGMGPLRPSFNIFDGSEYDFVLQNEMSVGQLIFWIKPLGHITTYSAWELPEEIREDNTASESVKGSIYFRAWIEDSGFMMSYDAWLDFMDNKMFEINPDATLPTYSAWETRAEVYANDTASESVKGSIYFRAWMAESGFAGTYEDMLDDPDHGDLIFKVEEEIT